MIPTQLGSGDWINLSDAAALCSEALGRNKTEEDILKAGYLTLQGVERLRIYTFPREPVLLAPSEESDTIREMFPDIDKYIPRLSKEERLAASGSLAAGQVFELNEEIFESLMLLRHFHSIAGNVAIIRARSPREFQGWIREEPSDEDSNAYWSKIFVGTLTPPIEILWADLRVDRQELLEFIECVKAGGSDDTVVLPNRAKSNKKKTPPISFLAALVKLISEIARAAESKGKSFSTEEMPGTKAEFKKLADQRDAEFRSLSDSTFEDYIKGICKFKRGASVSEFYSNLDLGS
ncbi:hypothetical protein [Herbaspirillum huttiense]|uniref:hypothetical protein n=1 Tax=Herbaspirillum huttiense TaxID=863372 RepID=UPI0039B01809